MRKSLSVLSFAVLSATVAAQYNGEGPGMVIAPAFYPALGPSSLANGVSGTAQVLLRSLGGTNNYCCLSVYKTGVSGAKLMTGTWDRATGVFTKNNDIDANNAATGDMFQLSVSNNLLVAVYDTPSGCAYAKRLAPVGAFGTGAPVSGVPSGYIDPQLATIGGKLKLSYNNGQDIYIGDFDVNTGAVTGTTKLISNLVGNSGSHSSTPIEDATGEARAYIFSFWVGGGDSDSAFTAGVDDTDEKWKTYDTTSWLNNPAANGGTFIYAEAVSAYADPKKFDMIATASASVPSAGGKVNLCSFAPLQSATAVPYASAMVFGNLATAGLPIAGVGGSALGIDLTGLIIVSMPNFTQTTGLSSLSFVTGLLPVGARVYIQPILVDLVGGKAYLGNTAKIDVK